MLDRYQSAYASASISGTLLSPIVGGALYQAAPTLLWLLAAVLAVLAGIGMTRGADAADVRAAP